MRFVATLLQLLLASTIKTSDTKERERTDYRQRKKTTRNKQPKSHHEAKIKQKNPRYTHTIQML
jgi:hypothetical protein